MSEVQLFPEDVRAFQSDGAAWLASARVAANSPDPDHPILCEVTRRRVAARGSRPAGPWVWVVSANSAEQADEARAILARFES